MIHCCIEQLGECSLCPEECRSLSCKWCRIEVRLQGCTSSARLVTTFACAEASDVTEAIVAGPLSCTLVLTLLGQC